MSFKGPYTPNLCQTNLNGWWLLVRKCWFTLFSIFFSSNVLEFGIFMMLQIFSDKFLKNFMPSNVIFHMMIQVYTIYSTFHSIYTNVRAILLTQIYFFCHSIHKNLLIVFSNFLDYKNFQTIMKSCFKVSMNVLLLENYINMYITFGMRQLYVTVRDRNLKWRCVLSENQH